MPPKPFTTILCSAFGLAPRKCGSWPTRTVPVATIQALRSAGHDVWSATERARGAADADLAAQAIRDERLVLTFDHDFGELCVRGDQPVLEGVILLRIVPTNAADVTDLVLGLFARVDVTWTGYLSVVTREHIRQRPL